jgi:hypothetical protein
MSFFNLKTLPLGRPRQGRTGKLSVRQAWFLHHKLMMAKGAVPKRPYLPCDPHGELKCDDCKPLRVETHCYEAIPS